MRTVWTARIAASRLKIPVVGKGALPFVESKEERTQRLVILPACSRQEDAAHAKVVAVRTGERLICDDMKMAAVRQVRHAMDSPAFFGGLLPPALPF